MNKPTKNHIKGAVALATACDEMIEELGGVSFETPEDGPVETHSYFRGFLHAIEWLQGEILCPVKDEHSEELRRHFSDDPDEDSDATNPTTALKS